MKTGMVGVTILLILFAAGCDNGMMNGNGDRMTIVETAAADDQFDTLVTALKETGLDATLSGAGPYTVFAPTDEAFDKLPEGTLETLLQDENQQRLSSILQYHVVPGKLTAADVVRVNHVQTVNGTPLTIRTMNGTVMVNNARVIKTDIMTSNGVIHVIDEVLLPQ